MGKPNQFSVLVPEVDIDSFGIVKKNTKKAKKDPAPSTNANANKNTKKNKSIPNDVPSKKKNTGKDEFRSELGALPQKNILAEILYFMKPILIATVNSICTLLLLCLTALQHQLQNLAFSTNPKKTSKQGKSTTQKPTTDAVPTKPNVKKVKNKVISEDTENWKKRDDLYVNNINSKNLEEGILLSKLEQQKRLANGPSDEKENNKPKEPEELKKKKKKKATTVSLDEFQRATTEELVNKKKPTVAKVNVDDPKKKTKKVKEKFFDDVKESTKATILREKQQEQYKKILKIEDRKAMEERFTAEVEKRDFEIQALRLEVDSLKSELFNVKQRNKKLCEVIGSSEMKPKGELVVQLEKACKTRDEYSEEVSKLSVELEQEKTKVSNLSQEIKKLQGRRKTDN